MKEFFTNYPFAKIGLLGIPMLVFMLVMENLFPKSSPEGFQNFIIAFEFVRTPDQLHLLFKDFDNSILRKIDKGNYIDFGFMFTYSAFLFLFFRKAAKIFNHKWLLTGTVISMIVLLSDFSENLLLLKITKIYYPEIENEKLLPILSKLQLFTWIKWLGLAICFAMYSRKLIGKRILLNIDAVALILPFLFSFWALTGSSRGISKFTLSVTLAFALLIVYCFYFKNTKKG